MKRYIIVFVVIVMMISGAGCGKQQDGGNVSSTNGAGVEQPKDPQGGSEEVENAQDAAVQGIDTGDNASQQIPDTDGDSSAVIISKSNNMVSSDEKEKVLNDMSEELDRILNDLNNLDDIDEEDLEF